MLSLSFDPFPVLQTERLILRRPVAADAADVFIMRSDPEVMRYIPRPLAKSLDDVHALFTMLDDFVNKAERINWVIEWKESGKVLGLIGFVNIKPEHDRAEVGYSLARAWHRKGITREALLAVLSYGFKTMKLHSVEAIIDAENIASEKLLESAGFVREAFFREDFFYNSVYRDSVHFGILETTFTNS